MTYDEYIRDNFSISEPVLALARQAQQACASEFAAIEETAAVNQARVLKAFADQRIAEMHFAPTSGYGYNDTGREAIDAVFAQVLGTQDALVRHTMVSGTHALSTALFSSLRPGDTLVAATGAPYDTLEEVIGIRGEGGQGSLRDFGVHYRQVELCNDGGIDLEGVRRALDSSVKVVLIQRSRGYSWRNSLTVAAINGLIDLVHSLQPGAVCLVDNCYGEFVEVSEPKADLLVGSLIKNPGGGLAQTGGYIAGRAEFVELAASRLTSVGIGRECGASLGQNKPMLQGFFMAPHVVEQAMKTAVFCSALFELLGFSVCPRLGDARSDIITSVRFDDRDLLVAFCQGIQKGAPVDAFVTPEPWDMPGYGDPVIMAAGAFVQGASIELSADGPLREPYIGYMQGGLTYDSARIGILTAAQRVMDQMQQKGMR